MQRGSPHCISGFINCSAFTLIVISLNSPLDQHLVGLLYWRIISSPLVRLSSCESNTFLNISSQWRLSPIMYAVCTFIRFRLIYLQCLSLCERWLMRWWNFLQEARSFFGINDFWIHFYFLDIAFINVDLQFMLKYQTSATPPVRSFASTVDVGFGASTRFCCFLIGEIG